MLLLTESLFTSGNRVAECPHKLPYYATILSLLANEEYTPPPARIPAKPLVTITNPSTGDVSTTNGNGNAEDDAMQPVPSTPAPPQPINVGLEITKDLVKVFQNHLDARRWRGVRFCVSVSPYQPCFYLIFRVIMPANMPANPLLQY